MFTYSLLKSHAGIVLCGDYTTLARLHEVVHGVNEKSLLLDDKESWFLGLAYDARKAYEQQRQVLQPPTHLPEKGVCYGVEIIWPVILLQCSMLRTSLSTFDSTKLDQAMTYALEYIIHTALEDDFGPYARAIIENWERIDNRHPYPGQNLDSRGAVFCSWSKKERREGLAGLLASLNPMYPTLFPIWERNGAKHLIAPEKFDELKGTEWVDPRW
ncbi:DUF6904 family protein [Pseudomonas chlororaphis subsp. piscium]